MASSITIQGTLPSSPFLGRNNTSNRPHRPFSVFPNNSRFKLKPCAKFNLFELLGGRGLCNGEQGIQQELERDTEAPPVAAPEQDPGAAEESESKTIPENAFEKELMGLTGGFPGGEKGLMKFIEENPPPEKQSALSSENLLELSTSKKPKAPALPLLMPGMIVIVSNPNSPYHMYCGIVQRITDGRAAVLFEGGNWDRLITFRLEELQRREKGPPGKNPKSAIIEELVAKKSE